MPGPEYVTVDDYDLVVGSSPVGLTGLTSTVVAAMVTVGDVAVRFKLTGSVPSTSSGHRAPADSVLEVYGGEVGGLRLVSEGADSTCFVSLLRRK